MVDKITILLHYSFVAFTQQKPVSASHGAPETISLAHSSFLQAATYDAVNYSMTLDFKSMHQIVYRFVFPVGWQQFKEAKSHGSHYARQIKGKYPAVTFRNPLKVSDFTRAVREHRPKAKLLKNNPKTFGSAS